MRAYISVLAHPYYAVTADDGRYELKGLPDGEYEIEAIHSELKSITGKASVKGGAAMKLDLAYAPQKVSELGTGRTATGR